MALAPWIPHHRTLRFREADRHGSPFVDAARACFGDDAAVCKQDNLLASSLDVEVPGQRGWRGQRNLGRPVYEPGKKSTRVTSVRTLWRTAKARVDDYIRRHMASLPRARSQIKRVRAPLKKDGAPVAPRSPEGRRQVSWALAAASNGKDMCEGPDEVSRATPVCGRSGLRAHRRSVGGAALACLAFGLLAPSSALAARTWYVAPNGSEASFCVQQEPCTLKDYAEEWVPSNEVKAGDTVMLAGNAGTYGSPGTPITFQVPVPAGVTLTGTQGQPMPKVYSKFSGIGGAFELKGAGSVLSDVDVELEAVIANSAVEVFEGSISRVIAHATDPASGCSISFGEITITDSVCAGRYGVFGGIGGSTTVHYVLRNTTAYGSEHGLHLTSEGASGGDVELTATNTIIRSGVGGKDVYAEAKNGPDSVFALLEYSNYASTETAGSGSKAITPPGSVAQFDQTASPLFVNLGADDFHEAPGSPTIDAGIDSVLNGPLDLEGNARHIGPHTDIGAYEFVIAPIALTGAASGVGQSMATLNGMVNPNGAANGSYRFVYGTTTSYGNATATASAGLGTSSTRVSANLTGLAPNTTYHYQLLASNEGGESFGGDRTFTTSSTGTATGTETPIARAATLAGLSETNKTFAPAASSTPLTGHTARRHKRGTVFSFTLDQTATVAVQIQRIGTGRRAHRTCKAARRRLRHSPKCTIYTTVATLTRSGHAGLNKLPFTGRIAGKALNPGRYRALFSVNDAAGASKAQGIAFTIVAK